MTQIASHFDLNLDLLKQCREQIGLTLTEVKEKVASIEKIEDGNKRPTYKQLDTLADLYQVPEWVFIVEKLPERYCYSQSPSFRSFKNSPLSNHIVYAG